MVTNEGGGTLTFTAENYRPWLDLMPDPLTWDAQPPATPGPDGSYACAVPGVTKAW